MKRIFIFLLASVFVNNAAAQRLRNSLTKIGDILQF